MFINLENIVVFKKVNILIIIIMIIMYLIFNKILNNVIIVINWRLIVFNVIIWLVSDGFSIMWMSIVNIEMIIMINVIMIIILWFIIFCLFFL